MTGIQQERRAAPTEQESLALIVIQQKGLIRAAEESRREAREAAFAAKEAHVIAEAAHDMLLEMRKWQEKHEYETRPLMELMPDLIQVTRSLQWVITGRTFVLWVAGGVIALAGIGAALDSLLKLAITYKAP